MLLKSNRIHVLSRSLVFQFHPAKRIKKLAEFYCKFDMYFTKIMEGISAL